MAHVLKNFMEEYVLIRLDDHFPKMDVCQCELCKLDIAALVLNEMPPKYIVTDKGQIFTKINFLQQQYEVDIITEIAKAAKIVKAFPRHETKASE